MPGLSERVFKRLIVGHGLIRRRLNARTESSYTGDSPSAAATPTSSRNTLLGRTQLKRVDSASKTRTTRELRAALDSAMIGPSVEAAALWNTSKYIDYNDLIPSRPKGK